MYYNAVLIPALDPDVLLIDYVKDLRAAGFCRIIVINDGSRAEKTDIFKTLESELGCDVIVHEVNMGKGRALKDGFAFANEKYGEEEGYRGVICADSDGQHSVGDVIKLSDLLDSVSVPSLILGCRNFDLDFVPERSRKGNKITTFTFKLLYGKHISDTQTGLRGISRELADEYVTLDGDRFEYETNMLIYAVRRSHNIVEEPIETIYINNNSESHFRPFVDSFKIYKLLFAGVFKFFLSGVASMLLDQGLANLLFYVVFGSSFAFGAKAIARAVSALFNFTLNKNFVFKAKNDAGKQGVRYAVLCVLQLLVSSTAVWILTGLFAEVSWAFTLASLAVDAILFFFSYSIQQKWVFKS